MRRAWCIAALLAAPALGCFLMPSPEPRTPCYEAVRGTLWPPQGEPLFGVSGRTVRLERASQPVAETSTDRRGRFELRALHEGVYSVVFSTSTHAAAAELKLAGCYTTTPVDLFVTRR